MEVLREVTVWESEHQPNHIYLMDGQKALAYIRFGQGEPFYFKNGITIDKRGRKFVPADLQLFKIIKEKSNVREVQGSKGQIYHVNDEEGTCSCPGFTFRGSCKHLGANG